MRVGSKNGRRRKGVLGKVLKTRSKESGESPNDPHANYKPARMFPAGLIRKKLKTHIPGIDKYPFNLHSDFKFFHKLSTHLSGPHFVQIMKLFQLYRLCIINSEEFLGMLAPHQALLTQWVDASEFKAQVYAR